MRRGAGIYVYYGQGNRQYLPPLLCYFLYEQQMKKKTVEEIKAEIKSVGFKCLNINEYKNNKTILKWECPVGHQWNQNLNNILNGSGCRDCAPNKRVSLEEIKEIAEKDGYTLLSKQRYGTKEKLDFECPKGFKFAITIGAFLQNQRCKYCSNGSIHPNDLKEAFITNGIQNVSNSLEESELHLKCQLCDHEWKIKRWKISKLINNEKSLCINCRGTIKYTKSYTLHDIRKIVKTLGWKLVGNNYYKNNKSMLNVICNSGHHFAICLNDITNSRGCSQCEQSFGESLCRTLFEKIFNQPFNKLRPNWLRNSSGNQLELDGLNQNLSLAFEHQGSYHYNIKSTIQNDLEKREICRQRGVKLIEIPEIGRLTKLKDLPNFLSEQFAKYNIVPPKSIEEIDLDLIVCEIRKGDSNSMKRLEELRTIAHDRKGVCLSTTYLGVTENNEFSCYYGHKFEAAPSQLKDNNNRPGTWCNECANKRRGRKKTT